MTALIAIAMGAAILAVSFWVIRYLGSAPPPEPDPDDVEEVSVDYRCSVCGMRLTVTHAQGDEVEAPRHCREEMEVVGP